MWVFALEWAYILRKLGWLSKWGFGCSMSGHLSVCPGPHSHVKLKSESQPQLPQNLPWIESTGNLSGATVIEINWILEIITLMLMWVLRRDNSPGDNTLERWGGRICCPSWRDEESWWGGWVAAGVWVWDEVHEVIKKRGDFREAREE